MKKTKPYTQAKLLCINLGFYTPNYKLLLIIGCFFILFRPICKAQNLVPNPGFEQVYLNENNLGNLQTGTYFWSNVASADWFHINNINPQTGNICNSPYCATVPKNWAGRQYPHNGLAYAGIISYFRNSFSHREMLYVPLTDSLEINKNYCVSFYVSLADTVNYAHSLLSALFIKDTMQLFNRIYDNWQTWTDYFAPQVTNSSGFLSSKTNWMKVEGSFVADSAYKYIVIGLFTNVVLHDTLYVAGGTANVGNPYSYYYVDDVSVTALDEPVSAALTDTIITTDTSTIQLGNNTNINASYTWWPAANLNDASSANPTLNVNQSGWYYVQKTQCSYVTYDSVYVKANPTGIKEYVMANALYSVHPNPNNGEFVLQHKLNKAITGALYVYDAMGKLLEQLPVKEQSTIEVNLKEAKGIYFLRLADASNTTIYLGKVMAR